MHNYHQWLSLSWPGVHRRYKTSQAQRVNLLTRGRLICPTCDPALNRIEFYNYEDTVKLVNDLLFEIFINCFVDLEIHALKVVPLVMV